MRLGVALDVRAPRRRPATPGGRVDRGGGTATIGVMRDTAAEPAMASRDCMAWLSGDSCLCGGRRRCLERRGALAIGPLVSHRLPYVHRMTDP
jgi:hypothetical protein